MKNSLNSAFARVRCANREGGSRPDRDSGQPGCAVPIVGEPGDVGEAQTDGRVPGDDAAALKRLGEHDVIEVGCRKPAAFQDGTDGHLGQLEGVHPDE